MVGIASVVGVSVVSGVNEVTAKIEGASVGDVDKAGNDEISDDLIRSSLL